VARKDGTSKQGKPLTADKLADKLAAGNLGGGVNWHESLSSTAGSREGRGLTGRVA
jgi:hypothetical protein